MLYSRVVFLTGLCALYVGAAETSERIAQNDDETRYNLQRQQAAGIGVGGGGGGLRGTNNNNIVAKLNSKSVQSANPRPNVVHPSTSTAASQQQNDERWLLYRQEACADDINRLCEKSLHHNNFAVLDCVQNSKRSEESELSPECNHLIWGFKRDLTKDNRFDEAARQVCSNDIDKFPECKPVGETPGQLLSCLMSYQENITNPQCKQFLTKMGSIIFSDYRLIYKFTDACSNDIDKFRCGRLDVQDKSPHSQGATIECLSKNPKELSPQCQTEILRIAEIQSEDFHLDRPLFFACREDRDRFCEKIQAGDGKVYRCLMNHKTHKDMSQDCRAKLSQRQTLIGMDYKVSKGLAKSCREDIRAYRCRDATSKNRDMRLAQILLCLEISLHKGYPIEGACQAEMLDHRRSLMEDFQLNPAVVNACQDDINKFCNERLEGNGRTIHCLMDHARPSTRKKKRISEACKRELEVLVHDVDVGEDWRVDPVLTEACQSVVDVACKDFKAGEGRVLSCLMDKVGSDHMTDECEEKLLQIQYFIARDYRLDPKLYQNCNADAKAFCNAGENWADDPHQMGPKRGPLLPCLFRYAELPKDQQKLSVGCIQEVKRVMRQRANNVDLHPEIELACIDDLADICLEKVNKGEEIVCLQDNLEHLSLACQEAIGNYTEEEAEHMELNVRVYKACEPLFKQFCEDIIADDVDQGDLMQCLLQHKNDYNMHKHEKCHAALQHFQLIALKDFRFSFKFKEACKKDVVEFCKNVRTKSDVVSCLSETVRNDTLDEHKPRVSKECRQQLRVELLQRNEDIELAPKLKEACSSDREKFCGRIASGNAQVLECLKAKQKLLSEKCYQKIFNRQQEEMLDNSVDFALTSTCKSMIKLFCDGNPVGSLHCLKDKKDDRDFDAKCRSLVLKRMAQQNIDYRLNPRLRKSCTSEINKFCAHVIRAHGQSTKDHGYEGKVIECLKEQFQVHRLRKSCEDEISRIIQETQLDYRQDPILAEACKEEITNLCSDGELLEAEGNGLVEECLKLNFQKSKIKNLQCHRQVAKLIQEGSADVHADPLLFKACVSDIHHYCSDIPPGEGKQMKCLLDLIKSKSEHLLQEECRSMLRKRMEMYNNAVKVAPPENVLEIVDQVVISPSRNYFIVVALAIIGSIFIGGLFCGRITKRVHYDSKRK